MKKEDLKFKKKKCWGKKNPQKTKTKSKQMEGIFNFYLLIRAQPNEIKMCGKNF